MSEVRLIDANALIQDLELSKYIVPNDLNRLLNSEINRCIEAINNAPTVPLPDFKEGYKQAIIDGKTNFSRPQGDCEKCDFRKFSETFIDGVVDVMNKNGITSVEQLSELLKGGAENDT